MNGAPKELEDRYRRFLNGRGDVTGPLICLLQGDSSGERADSRAWAALLLSRIYLLKGRPALAISYLKLSAEMFQQLPRAGIPLGLWVNRAIALKWQGKTRRAESLLRRVFELAVRRGDSLAAANAAANLALILVRWGRRHEARAAVDFARQSYRALHLDCELARVELVLSLIEFADGRCEEAIDRAHCCMRRCGERSCERGMITGALLLLEMSLRRDDDERAHRFVAFLSGRADQLRRFRPLMLRFMYLCSIHLRKRGDRDAARRLWRRAERLRRGIGLGCRGLSRLPSSVAPGAGAVDDRSYVMQEPAGVGCEEGAEPRSLYAVTSKAVYMGGENDTFITCNRRMQRLIGEVRSAAPFPLPVLITGESGVGKELVARLVHAASGRERRPFVAANTAALPHELFESILFGHARGAFTGATARRRGLVDAADGGTLFLDEIGEVDPLVQTKLLRLLDRGEYIPVGECSVKRSRARIVTSTNRDLAAAVAAGDFREDLYHRLNVLSFRIPPLRERRDDVPLLVDHFVRWCCAQYNLGPLRISDAAKSLLNAYDWPGNVRELRHELLRAVVRKRRGTVRVCHLSARIMEGLGGRGARSAIAAETAAKSAAGTAAETAGTAAKSAAKAAAESAGTAAKSAAKAAAESAGTLPGRLAAFERREIMKALHDGDGNVTRAAFELGLKRTTLFYRMKRLGIE